MKIVIDLRIYGPQVSGGLGRYNQQLVKYLLTQDRVNQYILVFKDKPIDLPALPDNFQVKIYNCSWYGFREQFIYSGWLKKLKPDLVHFTHFNVPLFYNGQFVVTIHDLIMTKFPSRRASRLNVFMFALKYFFYDKVMRHALRKAVKIITVSNFVAEDIKEYYKLTTKEASKICTIYEGLTLEDRLLGPQPPILPKKFFLYVGNAYPHKNLEFLVKTFWQFLKRYPDFYLILVGPPSYFYQRLKSFVAEKKESQHIIFPGFVSDQDLPYYYQQATAYIFPSLYEGFGLPPLEAMFYRLPVLSSNSSCLPEILGDVVLFFDPQNDQDLLRKMNIVSKDQDLREDLINRGLEQIKKYSWSKMVGEIIKVYNEIGHYPQSK
jgi:glycosyltransferase involved in cell wall biosynthesis